MSKRLTYVTVDVILDTRANRTWSAVFFEGPPSPVNRAAGLVGRKVPLRTTSHQALSFIGSFAAAASAFSMKGSIWLATAFTTGTTTLFPN